jgi:hypothetical protein
MNREFRKRKALAKRRTAKGITLVWSAIMLIAMIGFLGIVIDVSFVHLTANQLQNAADAAALAGARMVRIDQAYSRDQAVYIGGLNKAARDPVFLDLNPYNLSDGDIVIGRYSFSTTPRFTPTDASGQPKPNAMKVVARRIADGSHQPLPLFFGPILLLGGIEDVNVSRYAIAEAEGGLGAGLLVLSEDPTLLPKYYPPLQFSGNPVVEITDGAIQVNMPDPYLPVPASSHPTLCADEFNVVSKIDPTDGYPFCPATGLTITTGQPRIPDPYRNLPAPTPNPATPKDGTITSDPMIFQPGYYPDGIDKISTGHNITFMPGIYIVGGGKNGQGGLIITGGNVCAMRVMFYIMGDNEYENGTRAGNLSVTGGTGNVLITEINDINPGAGCDGNTITYSQGNAYVAPYRGISFFQSRTNPDNDASVGGGTGLDIKGTLYFPRNHVNLSGGSSSLGIEVVAYTVNIVGTGPGTESLLINYDGRNRRPAGKAYLVE